MENFTYLDWNSNNNEELTEFDILKSFNSYNVIKERIELYKDFTKNLLYYINDTYLGQEYIKTEKDIRNHFTWCYGKVLEEFYDEEIDFYGNDDLFNYFYEYYKDQFYKIKKSSNVLQYFMKFWDKIFDYKNSKKNRREFEVLLELYEIFDFSLSKKLKKRNNNNIVKFF